MNLNMSFAELNELSMKSLEQQKRVTLEEARAQVEKIKQRSKSKNKKTRSGIENLDNPKTNNK